MKYLTLFATLVVSQVQSCDPYVIEDNTTRTHIYEIKLDFQKENPTIAFCHLHQQMESVLLRTHDIQDVEGEDMVKVTLTEMGSQPEEILLVKESYDKESN